MIHLVVALPAEARGITRGLGLSREVPELGLRHLYRGIPLHLVVSGPGRYLARRAVESIAEQPGSTEQQAWLNVGIAGHADLPPGTCLLAEEIRESSTGLSWQPSIPFPASCPRAPVCTVDRPETEFSTDAAYDMEASGFFAAASRVADRGLVQVVKVVSDNVGDDVSTLTSDRVESLIHDAAACLGEMIEHLQALALSTRRWQSRGECQ